MNLFTYLLAKKGKNSLVHKGDLFAYLLGMHTTKTATGTTIIISDVKSEKIVRLTLSKESSQDGTPTPINPVEVKTVKNNVIITVSDGTTERNYTIPLGNNEIAGMGDYKDELIIDENGHCWVNKKITKYVFTGNDNITKVPSSSGENTSLFSIRGNFPISNYSTDYLNNYSLANSTSSSVNSDIGSYVFNNSVRFRLPNTIAQDTAEFRTWISSITNILYYPSETPEPIDLNYEVDIRLFTGVNRITNSENMDMTLIYK